MVLAVDDGHHMNKSNVTFSLFLTIIGVAIFVGSQAREWSTFHKGVHGSLKTRGGNILQYVDAVSHRVTLADFGMDGTTDRIVNESKIGLWSVR